MEVQKLNEKTARGYRLKPSTHNLIQALQEITTYDQDKVIKNSCELYYNELKKSGKYKTETK
jgi:hypothetical protein